MIIIAWPTPDTLFLAADICRQDNKRPEKVMEIGQRTFAATLAEAFAKDKGAEIMIIAPIPTLDSDAALQQLREITESGSQVHWYLDHQDREAGDLQTWTEIAGLQFQPLGGTTPASEIRTFLRYKITQAFLGDTGGGFNRQALWEAVTWFTDHPDKIPREDQGSAAAFANLNFPAIEGSSIRMRALKREIHRVAISSLESVLLLGETGTGKEAAAFFLHDLDPIRHNQEFRAINCAGLQEDFLISELFGHTKGAFTGAVRERPGLIPQLADGGTLFLDELPEMSPRVQAMLLRFLESGTYTPMGSDTPKFAPNLKIIAGAQGKLLAEGIAGGRFRKDLYYRLAGKTIALPNLRDIPDDLPIIIDHLAYKMEDNRQKRNETIAYFAARMPELQGYSWPGNVRQLANYVKRRLRLGPEEEIVLGEDILSNEQVEDNLVREGSAANTTAKSGKMAVTDVLAVGTFFKWQDPSMTIYDLKKGNVKFRKPQEVGVAYTQHVYELLSKKGASPALIAQKLQISPNTLRKHLSA